MNWLYRFRLMPLLVVVAALSFGVRFGEFVTGVSSSPGNAQAQSASGDSPAVENPAVESPPEEELSAEDEDVEDAEKTENAEDVEEAATDEAAEGETAAEASPPKPNEDEPRTASGPNFENGEGEKIEWKDAADADLEYSTVKMELFEDLSARRKDLEGRERELGVREALLKAAEQELDLKYKELISLRSEIQELLVEQSEEEKKRVVSLVKIYEGMKPKDAARIFNTLDLDILLQVVSQMSERKSAPIIASMDPSRARTLTIMLMEQKSLPDLSGDMDPVKMTP